ncbi:polysaccharide deacetylase family protein [Streptomyces sp. NPDC059398]|uniref:polysaccharide deacetylase family protein n=1 Tax=Streptomyces sp. NPDC059398 TaxID=3346820 RepID=UPI0036CF1A75
MLYAGISWHRDGYRLAVVDEAGRTVLEPTGHPSHRVPELVSLLKGLDAPTTLVVDSTNGTIDGRLMAAGLRVHRADPALLPSAPRFGSVEAEQIARAAALHADALVELERHRGTQTCREDLLAAWIAGSAEADLELESSGLLFSHGDRTSKQVALTFDDGPLPRYTRRVLDVLERYEVPATFFCCGIHVAGEGGEQLLRMREQGHTIGNHTWSHPFLPELTRAGLTEQIDRAGEAIAQATGGDVPHLFRPPYGARTPEVLGWLRESGTTTVLWDVAPDDWALRPADVIARDVLADVRPGSVVLLHDGGGDRSPTVDSLAPIIEGLLARGYEFVLAEAMSDCARARPAGVA